MPKSHEEWMRQAIDLAVDNVRQGHGGPFGALVIKGEKLVATGVNSVTANNDPTAHAEVMAIRAACLALGAFQLDGCTLYTSCEPCPMCLGAIFWARPVAYYYACTRTGAAQAGFDDAFIYDQVALAPGERSIPGHCVQTAHFRDPFAEWAKSNEKTPY
ncbi:MAG: nucleoside deaminase [Bryobacteraceae bacterium]